jgi:peptidoglycan/LPS O-acetylase OafA/YrhL
MLGRIQGARRIPRHLWRMCFALWIAATSFLLGQAEEFPTQLRIYPLLAVPMLLVFMLMLYWLVRVLSTNRFRRLDS